MFGLPFLQRPRVWGAIDGTVEGTLKGNVKSMVTSIGLSTNIEGGVSITSHMCLIYNSRIPEESVAQNSNMYVCVWKRSQEFRNPALVASSNLMCQIRTCMYVSERRSQEFRNPVLICAKFEHVCMCLQGEPGILMSSLFVKFSPLRA